MSPTAEQKRQYREYVISLKNVLPCKYCRINLVKNLKKFPLTTAHMESRVTFSKYIYDLHELVNKMLAKKSGLTFEDVRDRYEHFRSRCGSAGGARAHGTRRRTRERAPVVESGCVDPLHGKKLKCVLKITPREKKCESFQM